MKNNIAMLLRHSNHPNWIAVESGGLRWIAVDCGGLRWIAVGLWWIAVGLRWIAVISRTANNLRIFQFASYKEYMFYFVWRTPNLGDTSLAVLIKSERALPYPIRYL